LLVSGKFWTVDTMYFTEIDQSKLLPRFLYYVATQLPYAYWVTSTALPSMTQSDLASARIPYIDRAEQAAIAAFLDRETAEIDAFIRDQEELIRLLNERRAAIEFATFAPLIHIRDSPAPDEFAPMSALICEKDVRAGMKTLELYSVSIHHGVVRWSQLHDKLPKAEDFTAYKQIQPGEIVLNRMRAFQGAVGQAFANGMVSPDYGVFSVRAGYAPEFVHMLMRSAPFVDAMRLRLRGIGDEASGAIRTPRINARDLLRIRVAVCAPHEQAALLKAFNNEVVENEASISDAQQAIALLRERRSALISAAVTGKIDVRKRVRGA